MEFRVKCEVVEDTISLDGMEVRWHEPPKEFEVKFEGKPVSEDTILKEGDILDIISDNCLTPVKIKHIIRAKDTE